MSGRTESKKWPRDATSGPCACACACETANALRSPDLICWHCAHSHCACKRPRILPPTNGNQRATQSAISHQHRVAICSDLSFSLSTWPTPGLPFPVPSLFAVLRERENNFHFVLHKIGAGQTNAHTREANQLVATKEKERQRQWA